MRVLVVGGGGREHALAWKIGQSPKVEKVFCAPGNAGTAEVAENVPVAAEDIDGLLRFARENAIGLTVVGPEQPLVLGIVDRFRDAGLRAFGPRARAAEIEGSKVFCKNLLKKYGIPTGDYQVFDSSDKAAAYVKDLNEPLVVKVDGLAAGKGVILCEDGREALAAIDTIMRDGQFGEAGNLIVVEEFLRGQEVSLLAFTDGETVLPLDSAQDHKAAYDGDRGPNTGGMGAYSPAPVVTPEIHRRVMNEVIRPTVRGMAQEGNDFTGFLYAGLMIAPDGTPRVLEYNVRFGDPETQPIMLRMKSDLVELCLAAIEGDLDQVEAEWDDRPSLGVVLAAGGYPGSYRKGDVIEGLRGADSGLCKVFHAGTASRDGQVVTSGGRVLCVCALGQTIADAQVQAYRCVEAITWPEVYYRTDIGYRAIARGKEK